MSERPSLLAQIAPALALLALGFCAWLLFLYDRDGRGRSQRPVQASGDDSRILPEVGDGAYREAFVFATGQSASRGLAVLSDGRLVVAGDRELRFFDREGKEFSRLALEEEPVAVAADGEMIVVALRSHGLIGTPDDLPARARRVEYPGGALITSVAIRGAHMVMADAKNPRLLLFTREGVFVRTLAGATPTRKAPQVPSPHFDAAFTPAGEVLLADPGRHRLLLFSLQDELISSGGKSGNGPEGFGGCCNPTDLAVLPDGLVATAEKGIPRIKICRPDGALVARVAGPEGFAPETPGFDLAAGAEGALYALDKKVGCVRCYRPKEVFRVATH